MASKWESGKEQWMGLCYVVFVYLLALAEMLATRWVEFYKLLPEFLMDHGEVWQPFLGVIYTINFITFIVACILAWAWFELSAECIGVRRMSDLERVRAMLNSLKPGQWIEIHKSFFSFVTPIMYDGTPIEWVLEGVVGSKYLITYERTPSSTFILFKRKREEDVNAEEGSSQEEGSCR